MWHVMTYPCISQLCYKTNKLDLLDLYVENITVQLDIESLRLCPFANNTVTCFHVVNSS